MSKPTSTAWERIKSACDSMDEFTREMGRLQRIEERVQNEMNEVDTNIGQCERANALASVVGDASRTISDHIGDLKLKHTRLCAFLGVAAKYTTK